MNDKRIGVLIFVVAIVILLAGYIFSTWHSNQVLNQVTDKVIDQKVSSVLPTPSKEQLEKAKENAKRLKIDVKNPLQNGGKGEGIKGF